MRAAYVEFLLARLAGPRAWLPVAAVGAGDERPLVGYQYVVLRCVPRVDREEFVNVGVVLYCQAADFLEAACHVDPRPAAGRWPRTSTSTPSRRPCAPSRRSARATARPACRCFPGTAPRFGFLKAPRSTVVQPGPVHGGLTADPATTLPALLGRLVG